MLVQPGRDLKLKLLLRLQFGLWCFVPIALVWQAQSALFLIASAGCSGLAAAWMGRWFARRLQGFTGDCLGATQQVSEIGFYLGAALALRWA